MESQTICVAIGMIVALASSACRIRSRVGEGAVGEARDSASVLARGEVVFRHSCASCHGPAANGAGSVSAYLVTKPRDFTKAAFKFRSTPSGTMPTDLDLVRTITSGVRGTAMPAFAEMDRGDVLALCAFVRRVSGEAVRGRLVALVEAGDLEASELDEVLEERVAAGEPIEIPAAPAVDAAAVDRGRKTYARMGCVTCHGPTGRGDGPSSLELVDDWGRRIVAADFTRPGGIKGGSSARDIYRTFMTGMDGTPMPSFAHELEQAEAWDLAAYVEWLRRERR